MPSRIQLLGGQVSQCLLIAVAGIGAFVVPTALSPASSRVSAPLFPLLRTAIEHMTWQPLVALGFIGLLAGAFTRLPVVVIALSSVALLPVAMFAEIFADPTSHNLFPFELVYDAILALPALIGASVAVLARRALGRRPAGTTR